MDYAFNLNWGDLGEELRERLIDEYITYCKDDYASGEENSSEDLLKDERVRADAERSIGCHFPVYF